MALTIEWLWSKIRVVTFSISNISIPSNLCHSSCDLYDIVKKDNDFYVGTLYLHT